MATPASKQQLKEWILRELGSPVISVNISEQQIEDRIQDALDFWQTYHYEAYRKTYIAHQTTLADKANKFIPLDESVIAVNGIFKTIGYPGYSSDELFNVDYQLRLNDLWDLSQANITGYVIARQYIELLNDVLNKFPQVRFKTYEGKLYIDTNWDLIGENQFLFIDCYMKLNPEEFPRIYGDRVFRQLACAYARRQWGNNLSKFQNIQLPGGLMMNGAQILEDANAQIEKLEADFINKYQELDHMQIRLK